ncbi:permease-like cell division protein FtsX [Planotetraspora sp. GP83]|uniref:permease-like cell division protein FtsX n=1 Tax=Planotetraspora sp. GP83 TaxID=3156264 RepID=UPI0035145914
MSSIEDRLRDAMAARARTIQDHDRPLPAPRATGKGRVKTAAVTLAAAATVFGVVRLAAPPQQPQGEGVVAMSLSVMAPSDRPKVAVFLCKDSDFWPGCKGGAVTEIERENIRRALEARPDVESVAYEDQRQAYENLRRDNKNTQLLTVIVPEDLPESFRVQIRAGADFSAVARAASELPGVSNSIDQACTADSTSPWGSVKRFLGFEKRCSFLGKGR